MYGKAAHYALLLCALTVTPLWTSVAHSAPDSLLFLRNDDARIRTGHTLTLRADSTGDFIAALDSYTDFQSITFLVTSPVKPLNDGNEWAQQFGISWDSDNTYESVPEGFLVPITHTYPQPPNGLSEVHRVTLEETIYDLQGRPLRTAYSAFDLTIYAKPRIFADSYGDAFVQPWDEDCTTKTPMLFVEGIDVLNQTFPNIYYTELYALATTSLRSRNIEPFLLNFSDGGADLRANAGVVQSALRAIHELCPNSAIGLVGFSMGGLVCRYALAQDETLGVDHHVNLFISYDSPQEFAHANHQFQNVIKGLIFDNPLVADLKAVFSSEAAEQMLEYDAYDPGPPVGPISQHTLFFNDLLSLSPNGYPRKCYNAAVSNGALTPSYPESLYGAPLIDLTVHHGSDVPFGIEADLDLRDLGPGCLYPNFATIRCGEIPIGSSSNWIDSMIQALMNGNGVYWEVFAQRDPAFIPTQSALDFPHPWMVDEANAIKDSTGSPFDSTVHQTMSLPHLVPSVVGNASVLAWVDRTTTLHVNYAPLEGGSISADSCRVNALMGTSTAIQPKTITANGIPFTYAFAHWDDGSTLNPRTMSIAREGSRTAVMKAHLGTSSSGSVWTGGQRRVAAGGDAGHVSYEAAYESGGAVWYTRSRLNAAWDQERQLSSTTAGYPSVSALAHGDQADSVDNILVSVGWLRGDGSFGYNWSNDNGQSWSGEVALPSGVNPTPPVIADAKSIVWGEGASGRSGVYYYKAPETNRSMTAKLVPGTSGNVTDVACTPAGINQYEIAYVSSGHVLVAGFVDPSPSDPTVAPQLVSGPTDLTSSGWSGVHPSLVVDSTNIYVAWEESTTTTHRVAFAQFTNGAWSATTYLPHHGDQEYKPVVGIDVRDGMLNLLWACSGHVALATRPLGGTTWNQVASLGPGSGPSVVGVDPYNQNTFYAGGLSGPDPLTVGWARDLAPPDSVGDLGVEFLSGQDIWLSWTAPAVAGFAQAAAYDLRYSVLPIASDADFIGAPQWSAGAPGAPGSFQQVDVSGLQCGTRYYFALKTMSSTGHWSGMSDVRSARTLAVGCSGPSALRHGPGGPAAVTAQNPAAPAQAIGLPIRYRLSWDVSSEPWRLRVVGVPASGDSDSTTVRGTIDSDKGTDSLRVSPYDVTELGMALRARNEEVLLGATWHPVTLTPSVHVQGVATGMRAVSRVALTTASSGAVNDTLGWIAAIASCGAGDTVVVEYSESVDSGQTCLDEWLTLEGSSSTAPFSNRKPSTSDETGSGRLHVTSAVIGSVVRLGVSVPHAGIGRLEVFDATGRRVRTLWSGWVKAGQQDFVWDKSTRAGTRARSGVYLCRMMIGNERATTKVIF